jgi:SNF2 family DNA or RNA helicase
LTGTPMNTPLDLYGQLRFLDRGLLPYGTSWVRFRNHFAICSNPSIPQMITGYRNEEELQSYFARVAYRITAKEAKLGLPEVQHEQRVFDLSPAGQRVYDELERELITEVESGPVTVPNALVKLLRLQQITSGYLPDDDTSTESKVDGGKAAALQDLIEDTAEPVVVFCRFRHDLAEVQQIAKKLKRRYGELSGSQNNLTADATYPDNVDVLGVQIQSGGLGIDLTRARI